MNFPHPLKKPRHLKPGDRIAVVSPSWGGPGTFPHRYEAGVRQLEAEFGVVVVEMEHTRAAPDSITAHPELRAADLMAAFADPSISAIITSIGGDDSIRLIPYLDLSVIAANPKVFLGFSDTTTLHFACLAAGLTSFYGPAIMAGFAENTGMHRYTADAVRRSLFSTDPIGPIPLNEEGYTTERLEWADPGLQSQRRVLQPAGVPRMLQGKGVVTGHLIGGCAEVLEMLKGTAWWPPLDYWDGAIFFYETSEESPSSHYIRYWLRNFAAQGILHRLSGMLVARPDPGSDPDYPQKLEKAVVAALAEAGLPDLPVLSGLDFGHASPILTLPYGARASIDSEAASLTIHEAGVI
jgi:muramoyltetrapeptide carboxypeptidase LdcA involved in peptidoglycan recycling